MNKVIYNILDGILTYVFLISYQEISKLSTVFSNKIMLKKWGKCNVKYIMWTDVKFQAYEYRFKQ